MRSHMFVVLDLRLPRAIADALKQLDATGIRPIASAKRLQQEAYRAWLTGLLFNAVSGFYTLWQLRQREQNLDRNDGEGVVESKKIVKCVLLCLSMRQFADRS